MCYSKHKDLGVCLFKLALLLLLLLVHKLGQAGYWVALSLKDNARTFVFNGADIEILHQECRYLSKFIY